MIESLDSAVIQFTPEGLRALNAAQALMMFIVSLYLDGAALREVRRFPRAVAVGFAAQWLLLPAATLAVIAVFNVPLSPALGLLLIAACPAGNASGFLTLLARGNLALSVSVTAVSMLAMAMLTPLVFAVTVSLSGLSHDNSTALRIDPWMVLETVMLLLVLPLCAGLALRRVAPRFVQRIRSPLKAVLGLLLLLAIAGALQTNGAALQGHAFAVAPWVIAHNAVALGCGYALAWAARLPEAERRAIAIGTGITSSGIALLLVFSFFGGAGAMAVVVAAWSVWRLITGGLLALIWSRRPPRTADVIPVSRIVNPT